MADLRSLAIPATNLSEHPAAMAWSQVCGRTITPAAIDTLKAPHRKSSVYRLHLAGPGQANVIAKRCRSATAQVEKTVYTRVLRHLSVRTVELYGVAEDTDQHFTWLFLEDAGDQPYIGSDPIHRAAAAHWLAVLHREVDNGLTIPNLPQRGTDYYSEVVASAQDTIRQSLSNPVLTVADRMILRSMDSACSYLKTNWTAVTEDLQAVPATLVHGDFGEKNLRVSSDSAQVTLIPLDWETAGWGTAAADLSKVDVASYFDCIREAWTHITFGAVRRAAAIGKILWSLAPVPGERSGLAAPWVLKTMGKMACYEAAIAAALEELTWTP